MELGVREDIAIEGDGDIRDPRGLDVSRIGQRCCPTDYDRVASPTLEAAGNLVV